MRNLQIVFFFLSTTLCLELSFYVERNPNNRKSSDYLSVLLSDKFLTSRVLFKLPHRLSHQESFQLRICRPNTYVELSFQQNKEEFLKQNCLNDIYKTVAEVNYNVSNILEEKINTGIFKLCVFGFALPEAEQSFLMSSIYELETQKNLVGQNLYYNDTEQIVQLIKYAEKTDYRHLYQQKSFQCGLKFLDDINWDVNKFHRKLYQFRYFNQKSQLILEYEFEDGFQFQQIDHPEHDQNFKFNQNMYHQVKNNLMDQLSKKYKVTKRSFKQSTLQIGLHQDKDKSLEFKVKYNNYSQPIDVQYNLKLERNKYMRFVPILCYGLLPLNKVITNSFMAEYNCEITSKQKLLLHKDNNDKIQFLFNQQNEVHHSNQIAFNIPQLEVEYRQGKYKVKITGYESKCDIVLDQQEQVIYLISYQRTYLLKKNKSVENNDKLLSDNFAFLLTENSKLIKTRQDEVNHKFMGLIFAAGLIVCGLGVGLLFVNIIAGVIVGIIGLILICISLLRNRKFGYSYSEFLTTKQTILEQSQNLDKLYNAQPNGVVTIPIKIDPQAINIEDLDIMGIPDLDKNIIVQNNQKLEELHEQQQRIAEELKIIRQQQIQEEDNYSEEEITESLKAELGFSVNEIEFDLDIKQNLNSKDEIENFDGEVTKLDEFKQLLQAGKPVAVDFYADWCGPCKMIGPKFVKLAESHGDKITFLKVNVDTAQEISSDVGISCMPTFKFYKDGKLVATLEGANESKLNEHLQNLLQ